MQLACRPSRWLAGTRPGIGETFGSPPRCWGAVVSEVVRMRVSSCDPATRPIRPRPSYRTLNQHHLKRNRKFVDSPLEGGVWCELVSEFLESIKRGPNH